METSISVVTVCRNARDTIRSCLDSVRQQTLQPQHVIIDGCSIDGTLEILRQYADARTSFVSERDNGIYDAMNKGIARASGDVVGFLNADDYYADPKVIDRVAKAFSDNDIDACYGDLQYIDARDDSRVVRHWRSGPYDVRKFYWGWMPPHPTFFARRRLFEQFGGFRPQFGTAADYELMLRFLLKHRVKVARIPSVLVKMRTGGASNATLTRRIRANAMDREAWRFNGLQPRPWTLMLKPISKLPQFILR